MRADPDPRMDALTEKIIGGAFAVSTALGHGFLEAVYKNALIEEISALGLMLEKMKAVEALTNAHAAQVVNYLKASRLPIGFLMNFGQPRLQMKRVLHPSV